MQWLMKQLNKILDDSYDRVVKLLQSKERAIRDLSKNLYWYNYLDAEEMDALIRGKKLNKEKLRNWEGESHAFKF